VAGAPSAVGEGRRNAKARKRPGRCAQGGFFFFRLRAPLLCGSRHPLGGKGEMWRLQPHQGC